MKSNNNRAVAISSRKLDELYKEWSGEHHTTNSNKPVHDSAECCDFAEYCLKYGMEELKAKDNTKNSVLHIYSVVAGLFRLTKTKCPNCDTGRMWITDVHFTKNNKDLNIYECDRCKRRFI